MTELVIRPLAVGEVELFESLADPGLVGFAAFGDSFREMAAAGKYRPEWCWVALRAGVVVARAAWWGGPDDDEPVVLDWFDFSDAGAAAELLGVAPFRTQYSIKLPPDWREVAEVRRAAEARIAAATAAGLTPLVERYFYRWTPECGVPPSVGRLRLRAEPDDSVVLDVFRRVNVGSLDAHAQRFTAEHGADAAAQEELDSVRWLPSPREWWRLAFDADGALVGIAVPARNHTAPVIGFIGVVPEQRGHGYAHELLVEATRWLVDQGVEEIVAGTDVPNLPMAAAFARAGYPVVQRRIDLS